MTRDDIFKLWPRPWRMNHRNPGCVFDRDGAEILWVNARIASMTQADALAHMLVEWSQEKP